MTDGISKELIEKVVSGLSSTKSVSLAEVSQMMTKKNKLTREEMKALKKAEKKSKKK